MDPVHPTVVQGEAPESDEEDDEHVRFFVEKVK